MLQLRGVGTGAVEHDQSETDEQQYDRDYAALAHDALEADALVLAAGALPVLDRSEDLLAEESVLLGLERAVVDRFGLLDLALAPAANLIGGLLKILS